jgi:coenzyme F420-0:L-glutamate ligase/coenzyme F420-1:gamma-L-glutamate ligase
MSSSVSVAATLSVHALPGFPRVQRGDDLAQLIEAGLARARLALAPGDVLVVTSKVCARAEGRFVDLARVTPSDEAHALAREVGKDPSVVELVLRESTAISRKAPGVLVVRHRLGCVSANAGIDLSNAAPADAPPGSGPFALLLPSDPDGAARGIRARLEARSGLALGVVISDSHGRPFRLGSVGAALGLSGLPALFCQVGRADLDGRALESSVTALADQVAAAADLVAGQADEGRAVVLVRGIAFAACESSARELLRPEREDLYA